MAVESIIRLGGSPDSDTTIFKDHPTSYSGYPFAAVIIAGNASTTGAPGAYVGIRRALVKFDLGSIVATPSEITHAILEVTNDSDITFYWEGTVDPVLQCWAINEDWVPARTSWNGRAQGVNWTTPGGRLGGLVDSHRVGLTAEAMGEQTNTFTISDLLRAWLTGALPNYGMMLKLEDETLDTCGCLASGNNGYGLQAPYLWVLNNRSPVQLIPTGCAGFYNQWCTSYTAQGIGGHTQVWDQVRVAPQLPGGVAYCPMDCFNQLIRSGAAGAGRKQSIVLSSDVPDDVVVAAVRVHVRCGATIPCNMNAFMQVGFRLHGQEYYQPAIALKGYGIGIGGFDPLEWVGTSTVNPATNKAWLPSEINGAELVLWDTGGAMDREASANRVYVEVDYLGGYTPGDHVSIQESNDRVRQLLERLGVSSYDFEQAKSAGLTAGLLRRLVEFGQTWVFGGSEITALARALGTSEQNIMNHIQRLG